jgi:hypothetical protein
MSTPGHRWQNMEQQFEKARIEADPTLPSRLKCAFVFDDLEVAKVLLKKRTTDRVYTVKLASPSLPTYRAEMALVHPELEIYDAHVANPRSYWTAQPNDPFQWPEILTLSPLQVIEEIIL